LDLYLFHAAGNKKAPDLFRRGFGSDDAIVNVYARMSPEARQGFAVLAVRLVVVIITRTYAAGLLRRQRGWGQKFASIPLPMSPCGSKRINGLLTAFLRGQRRFRGRGLYCEKSQPKVDEYALCWKVQTIPF